MLLFYLLIIFFGGGRGAGGQKAEFHLRLLRPTERVGVRRPNFK